MTFRSTLKSPPMRILSLRLLRDLKAPTHLRKVSK